MGVEPGNYKDGTVNHSPRLLYAMFFMSNWEKRELGGQLLLRTCTFRILIAEAQGTHTLTLSTSSWPHWYTLPLLSIYIVLKVEECTLFDELMQPYSLTCLVAL